MKTIFTFRFALVCFALGGVVVAGGCSGSGTSSEAEVTAGGEADHGHDHGGAEAKDFPSAMTKLEGLSSKILKAFQDGTPEAAHDGLHSIGHLLEGIPALAMKSKDLGDEARAQVDEAVESLFDAFTELDGTLHGGEDVDVAAITEKVNQSMEQLRSAVQ